MVAAPEVFEADQTERPPMNQARLSLDTLDTLQRQSFDYFVHEVNSLNGLIADKTLAGAPASIAAVGLALSAYPVGVERAFITRAAAVERTLLTLRFFRNSPQGNGADGTGYRGFYYHFLDMKTGKRVWKCELSTVDTAFLVAGMLAVAAYFIDETADEREIPRWPMNFIDASIGSGHGMEERLSLTGGGRRAAFSLTGGKGMTKRCSCTCLVLVYRRIPFPPKATPPGLPHTSGRISTIMNCCMPAHCLSINFLMCGSILGRSKIPTCAAKAVITSKTAAGRRMCNSNTPFTIRPNSKGMLKTAGGLRQATALAG